MFRNGIHPVTLIAGYIVIALLPLGLAAWQGLPQRPFLDELASAIAMVGFSMLLMEFVLSGRFRWATGRVGIDVTMRFHQLIARVLAVFILVHPFLYSLPMSNPRPWDTTGRLTLDLEGAAFVTGGLAWLLLPVLVATSIFRRDLPYRYETWRLMHGIGAALIALLSLHHVLGSGRYAADPALTAFWAIMVIVAFSTLVHVYLTGPLERLRHPYQVKSVERIAAKSWELVIEPTAGAAMTFKPGQFVWLTLGRSPFSIVEHPFSISSCPADRPRIGFTIKEVGDFTAGIGSIPPGTPAYVDGPHGHMYLPEGDDAGVTFLAGGVGLAPIMSMLRQLRADGDTRPLRLIYGNRSEEQIMYRNELADMVAELDLEILHVLSESPSGWSGATGVIDETLLRENLGPDPGRLYVVCGPGAMIESVEDILSRLGIPKSRVLAEKFNYD
ncbi:MAG: ferredoxin reductase family protein [Gammaproteobacteria bacterium]|nr:ferredoxin reductase family protein [Gammaproteobacteria bacterium]